MASTPGPRRDEELVSPEVALALFDTHQPLSGGISCIAAAVREARQLVGRDPASGRVINAAQGGTWSGALVYLIFAEQIGSCFHVVGSTGPFEESGALRRALKMFGGFSDSDARVLTALRNRLAHDFTLSSPSGKLTFTLSGSAQEPVVEELSRAPRIVHVGLPTLAIRIEQLHVLVSLAANEGTLACHHPGGVAGVLRRFRFAIITS
jgi:hypothetical protein